MFGFNLFGRMVIHEIVNSSGLLEGSEERTFFSHNVKLLEEKRYELAGRLVGMSMMHDGPGLGCLDPTLFKLMCGIPCDLNKFDAKVIVDLKFVKVIEQVSFPFQLRERESYHNKNSK